MNAAIIRMLILQKMLSLLAVVSILLSLVEVYWADPELKMPLLTLNAAFTAVLLLLMLGDSYLYVHHMSSLNAEDNLLWVKFFLKLCLAGCSATPWTL